MYHPSIYVLVTDLDDMEEMEAAASQKCALGSSSSAEAAALAALSSANNHSSVVSGGSSEDRKPVMEIFSNNKLPLSAASSTTKSSLTHMIGRLKIDNTKVQPYYDTHARNFTCNTTNTHAPPQAACEMPERVWQDCVTNSLHIQHLTNGIIAPCSFPTPTNNTTTTKSTTSSSPLENTAAGDGENENNVAAGNGTVDQTENVAANADIKPNLITLSQKQQQIWGFIDPTQKAPCICTK